MKYNIRGDKMLITDAIKDYTETKLGRLEKYFKDDDITANVLAKVRGNSQIVEVTIPTSKFILRSEEESDDLYAAIDLVSDKLERQIRKNKTRLNRNVKDNIKEFIRDIDTAEEIELNINKLEYYAVKDDDIYLLAFEMLSDEDKISIKYVNNKVKEDKFLDIINYLNNILVVRTHLIIDLYNDKYMDVLSNNYKCKEIYVSLMKDDVTDSNSKYKEELAEIDMYNIRYLSSKNEIVCNLVKQNIQDERIILELNSKFITMNSSIISFIINDSMIELFTKELGYDVVYKSFVIVKE